MTKDYKFLFQILDNYLVNKTDGIDKEILNALEARSNGKSFSFKDHIKAFIYAQLSAVVAWKNVSKRKNEVNSLFFDFDKDKLKNTNPEILIENIKKLKCYSSFTTKNQMNSLKTNIEMFEKIEKDYGSLDNFIIHDKVSNVVKMLADNKSIYKLKYIGIELVCEYLRNIGIDLIKPDKHIKRLISPQRLNLVNADTDYEIIDEFKDFAEKVGFSQTKMDYLLWNYAARGYGEVCSAEPSCYECVIRQFCNNC